MRSEIVEPMHISRKGENGVFRIYGRGLFAGSMLLLLFLLAACNTASSSASSNGGAPISKATVVTARSVQGMPGTGPIVVTSPTPVPGGNADAQQVVLKDRTLVLNNVSKQDAAGGDSSLITLALTIKNTSNQPIMNESSFFQLMGAEGDTFTYQSNSSDNFYSPVPAHGFRNGTIVFQVPRAATAHLQLLYRPEVETETVLMPLKL